ncbi:dicarboxylate/amino acid:cation symporter [Alterisphingorhabdus coralli]|uniref:Dicarboxylate/amino acid:cation symporter n=1 Tax=Alterisphingorhabdus coralli TaxID=3071408 RepID=A0AA97F873_9SPHN|nr:dicarboxylate/amino acid:cation symporter [Parasphingorhabdus sp. SCSIO 66989]WOE75083.1 dicarboxylate/amino acid:cation symporter [Parasphingorhabdus sp. SCSIO 66989]
MTQSPDSPRPNLSRPERLLPDEVTELYRMRLASIHRLIQTKLWAQIIVAMVLGIILGLALSPVGDSRFAITPAQAEYWGDWLRLPGSLFLNMIQMIVTPLIMSSIALGIVGSGDPDFLRKVALRIIPYFVATTTFAVLIGVAMATVIQPGSYIELTSLAGDIPTAAAIVPQELQEEAPSVAEQIAAMIPSNLAEAQLYENMLQIVIASVFLGLAMLAIGEKRAAPMQAVLQSLQDIVLKIVGWAMLLAPLAVFGLIGDFVMRVGITALFGMSAYIITVLGGLALLLCVYGLIVTVFARRDPRQFFPAIADAQLLAFATSSSAATMPLSMRIATEKLRVRRAIARFIIPLGATVNMDGTALYQVVAALFLTQLYGVELDIATFALLTVTVVGASIGSPSTPGVGIVILGGILQSIGLPPEGIAILLGVDRLLDMCRTSVNVAGDLTACAVMDRWLADAVEPEDVAAAEQIMEAPETAIADA